MRVPALHSCHVPSPTSCAINRFPSPPRNLYIKLQASTISWEQGYNVYWLILIGIIGSTPEKVYWYIFVHEWHLWYWWWCMEGNKEMETITSAWEYFTYPLKSKKTGHKWENARWAQYDCCKTKHYQGTICLSNVSVTCLCLCYLQRKAVNQRRTKWHCLTSGCCF